MDPEHSRLAGGGRMAGCSSCHGGLRAKLYSRSSRSLGRQHEVTVVHRQHYVHENCGYSRPNKWVAWLSGRWRPVASANEAVVVLRRIPLGEHRVGGDVQVRETWNRIGG